MSMPVKNHSSITYIPHYMRNGLHYQKKKKGPSIFLMIKSCSFVPLTVASFLQKACHLIMCGYYWFLLINQ